MTFDEFMKKNKVEELLFVDIWDVARSDLKAKLLQKLDRADYVLSKEQVRKWLEEK